MKKILKLLNTKLVLAALISLAIMSCVFAVVFDKMHERATAASGYWGDSITDLPNYTLASEIIEGVTFYQINSGNDLGYLSRQSVVDATVLSNKNYILKTNIDLAGHYFNPIGSVGSVGELTGITFDGAGHYIDNLLIERNADYNGLFGYLEYSNIKNLELKNVNIVSGEDYGDAGFYTGAAAGFAKSCVFENIETDGIITAKNSSAGGIVGAVDGYDNVFRNCINGIDVTSARGMYSGGIFGSAHTGSVELTGCVNNGDITGIAYVAGIGSGSNQTSAVLSLTNCENTGKISSNLNSFNQNYFAGLIAYASGFENNEIRLSSNIGEVSAPNCYYVAGLVGFGKFRIEDSFNDAEIVGNDYVAGLAANGIFEVIGCHNGENGKISALSIAEDAVAAGIIGKYTGFGTVTLSHNKGEVKAANGGLAAGIIASFDVEVVMGDSNPVIISNCYNWGDVANAFIAANNYKINGSYNSVRVMYCYNLSNVAAVFTNRVYHDSASVISEATESATLAYMISNNPYAGYWQIDTISPMGSKYNNGYPYIRCGLVSELSVELDGGEAIGAFRSFYVQGLKSSTSLIFNDFIKTGYTFKGFSTVQNDNGLIKQGTYIFKDTPVPFVSIQQIQTLYVQYELTKYEIVTGVVSQDSDIAELYDADGTNIATDRFITLGTDKILKAERESLLSNEFSHWAIEFGGQYYQVFDTADVNLALLFNEQFLIDFEKYFEDVAGQKVINFVAVFEEAWVIEINLGYYNTKDWGKLEIEIAGEVTQFNFDNNTFRIVKKKDAFDEFISTAISLKLTAYKFYVIEKFNVAGDVGSVVHGSDWDKYGMTIDVDLKSDLSIGIEFGRDTYKLKTTSVYEDNYTTGTEDNLISYGREHNFEIGRYMDGSIYNSRIAAETDRAGYRFLGFKIMKADGKFESHYETTHIAGQLNSFTINLDFLNRHFTAENEINIIAVYRKQFRLNIVLESGENNAYGSIVVTIGSEPNSKDYVSAYHDIGTQVVVEIVVSDGCSILAVDVDGVSVAGNFTRYLTSDINAYIELEKIRYYINLFTIDADNILIPVERENIALAAINGGVPVPDEFGIYLTFDSVFKVENNRWLESNNYMKFSGWYYYINSSTIIPLSSDLDGNLVSALSKQDIALISYIGIDGRHYIDIVAKIVNIYLLDIELSEANSLRGYYMIEVWNETLQKYVEATKDSKGLYENQFDMGAEIRVSSHAYTYYSFARFESHNGTEILGDVTDRTVYTFELRNNTYISVFFAPNTYSLQFNSGDISSNGQLGFSVNNRDEDGNIRDVKIGDSVIISFSPDSNYEVDTFSLNGKTLLQLKNNFNARITDNSIVITVTEDFFDWVYLENDGTLTIDVSTKLASLFLVLMIALLVSIPALTLTITLVAISNSKKKKEKMVVRAKQKTREAGLNISSRIESIKKDNEGE